MKIIGKALLYLLFAAWIVLLVVLINYYIQMIELENLLGRVMYADEVMSWMVMIFIGGGLSLLLFYRPRCKRKWTRITRNAFAVVLLLGTLIGEIWAVGEAYWDVDHYRYEVRKGEDRERIKEVAQGIVNDIESGNDVLADAIIWAIHCDGIINIVQERDTLLRDFNGGFIEDCCEYEIESACKRAVERRAKEGNANAEFIKGEDYYDEWDEKRKKDWISSEELNEMMEHAFYWWSRSASHGCPNAYARMAQCYEGIIKIPTLYTNKQIAFDWWKKDAEAGYSLGYYNMGRMMIESDNPAEAKQYWKIAADMGNKNAKNALEKLYSDDVQPGAKKNNPPL